MNVTGVFVQDYRNISEITLHPCEGVNIIYGDNAQGKTNLLESIWLFCGAKSFRGGKDSELIRFGQQNAHLHLDFSAQQREQTADIFFGKEKKNILVNEIKQAKLSDLAGTFCSVVFSPDQLSMVKQGPEGRRRFLDVSLGQILPKYGKVLEHYERILRQRAHVLRDGSYHPSLLDMLEVWDEHLAHYGAYICDVRMKYSKRLAQWAGEIYEGIASGKETFCLSYKSSVAKEGLPDGRGQWEELLKRSLKETKAEDLRLGATTTGPHRDDLSILVDGNSARSFASQGQQRSCVLALKLAECSLIEHSMGESPVVLLDDVMSELDEGRRGYLLNHLKDRQVFITCCDADAFRNLDGGRITRIHGGKIEQSE